MNFRGVALGSLFLVFVLLAGCTQQTAAPSPSPLPSTVPSVAPSPSPVPSPSPAPSLTPMEFDYELSNWNSNNQGGKMVIKYWFEEEATCSGKKALNGIFTMYDPQAQEGQQWGKATFYYETGELGSSAFMQKRDLVFETTQHMQALPFFNFIQSLFAAAGKDFATSEVWNSTKPLALKDVVFSGGKGNVTVVKTGAGSGATPCTEFAIYSQNMPGSLIACATQPSDQKPYSYTIYIKKGSDWPANAGDMPSWKLTRAPLANASGEPSLLECMPVINCGYVEQPSGEERAACEAQGGKISEDYDANQCVTAYPCKSVNELAVEQVQRSQNPACSMPSQSVMNAVADCITNNKNIQWTNNQNGCITAAAC